MLGDAPVDCRAEARPYAHGRSVAIDIFNLSASHIASLLVLCSQRCTQFSTIAANSDGDLEQLALAAFLEDRLTLNLGSAIDSSEKVRIAGRVEYPGQLIVELHGGSPNNRLERSRGTSSMSEGVGK
jgi:hypothetical protein